MLRPPLAVHVALAVLTFLGPILAYHVNGAAWYDYGFGWNPPPYRDEYGQLVADGDYDPYATRPFAWRFIGPLWNKAAWLLLLPPWGLLMAVGLFLCLLQAECRGIGAGSRAWKTWAIGAIPSLYILIFGMRILNWMAD